MDKWFLAYRGNVLLIEQSSGSERAGSVDMCLYKLEEVSSGRNQFRKASQTPLQIAHKGEHFKVLEFECVLQEDTGLRYPCLLVQRSRVGKEKGAGYVNYLELFLLPCLESLNIMSISMGSFDIGKDNLSKVEVKLFDGPTVCWVSGHQVCVVAKESSTGRFTLKFWPKTDASTDLKKIGKQVILWCGNVIDRPLVLVKRSGLCDISNTTETTLMCIDVHQNTEYNGFCLVPNVYAAIVTCCLVCRDDGFGISIEMANDESKAGFVNSGNTSKSSVASHMKVLVGTTQAQLVEFYQGHFKNFWQLPFEDSCNINLLEVDSFELVAVVQSQRGQVCAINLTTHQVIREWTAAERILVDDFLGKGTEQVLILPSCQVFGDCITNFTITDFVQPEIIGEKEVSSADIPSSVSSTESSESLQRTVHALTMRLQAGISSVVESQIEHQDKQELIKEACHNLHTMVSSSGSHPAVHQQSAGMFCLLEGKQNEVEVTPDELHGGSTQVTVVNIWQRVVNDKWVVGIEVANTGASIISSISLALVSVQPEMLTSACEGEVGCIPLLGGHVTDAVVRQELTSSEDIWTPPVKKTKIKDNSEVSSGSELSYHGNKGLLPGDKAVVVAVTGVPEMSFSDEYICSPVLTCKRKAQGAGSLYNSICCAHVTISANQISGGNLELGVNKDVMSRRRDWAALEAVCIKTQLVLTSSLTSMCHVGPLLQNALGVCKDAVMTVVSLDRVESFPSFTNSSSPLSGACVLVQPGLREAKIRLLTRNRSQLYVILHKLRQVLPDDVTILTDTSRTSAAAVSALDALTGEVSSLATSLSQVMQTQLTDMTTAMDSSGCKGNKEEEVEVARREFESRRAQGPSLAAEVFVNTGDVSRLWDSILEEQFKTDRAVNTYVSLS